MVDVVVPDYAELIRERIATRDGTPLPNGTLAHATMLLEAMFLNASKCVRILTGELNARVYGTPAVISAARQFLADSNHRLEIIFEGPFDDGEAARHPLLTVIGSNPNVSLWRLRPEVQGKLRSHFALMDDDSYRFEPDKREPSAVAAFGDPAFNSKLREVFERTKTALALPLRIKVPA
jgi:hypothetical protein